MPAAAQSAGAAVPAAPAVAASPSAAAASARPVQETEGVVTPVAPRKDTSAAKPAALKQIDAPARAARESRPAATQMARQEQTPAMPGPAPASQPPASAPPIVDSTPATPRPDDRAAAEAARPAEPPAHMFEELVVSADSVLGLQTENRVSSETARVEDHIDARVTRDVRVGGKLAIPAGSRALGSVVLVERGGKVKERAKLGVRFHTLVLADGTRIPIATDPIYRDGEAPGNGSASKIGGGAVAGTILGAILGGGKGAAIGAAAGAGAGSAAVASSDRQAATLAAGSPLTVRILQPITVTTDSK
jgi:hypothetical protein